MTVHSEPEFKKGWLLVNGNIFQITINFEIKNYKPSAQLCLPVVHAEDSSSQVTPNFPSGHSQLEKNQLNLFQE